MESFYAPGRVVRWEPVSNLAELPLASFDMTWSDRTLVCSARYGLNSTEECKGLIIQFEDVHAFASFDGFSDILLNERQHLLPLKIPVLYGGCWPFLEVEGSRWVKEITAEHGGLPEEPEFAHWAVITFDQTLHVMAPKHSKRTFVGWIS